MMPTVVPLINLGTCCAGGRSQRVHAWLCLRTEDGVENGKESSEATLTLPLGLPWQSAGKRPCKTRLALQTTPPGGVTPLTGWSFSVAAAARTVRCRPLQTGCAPTGAEGCYPAASSRPRVDVCRATVLRQMRWQCSAGLAAGQRQRSGLHLEGLCPGARPPGAPGAICLETAACRSARGSDGAIAVQQAALIAVPLRRRAFPTELARQLARDQAAAALVL